MNCSDISPIDHVPVRSPQAVHTALLPHLAGKDVVEIGTRRGDDVACYVNYTRTLKIFEIDKKNCRYVSERLQKVAGAKYAVYCNDYRRGSEYETAEIVLWWQHPPHLLNERVLRDLGAFRARRGALAISMHDGKYKMDMQSYHHLRPHAVWSKTVEFDERALCCTQSRKPANCAEKSLRGTPNSRVPCDRAFGRFHLLAFNRSTLASKKPYL